MVVCGGMREWQYGGMNLCSMEVGSINGRVWWYERMAVLKNLVEHNSSLTEFGKRW